MDIVPYENNAKIHNDKQLELLAKIVAEVGWRQNVEVNQEGIIVVGHGRYLAWNKYKNQYDLPDVWITDDTGKTIHGEHATFPLTKEQENMWRVADNQVNAMTGLDMDLLIPELKAMDAGMLDLTGLADKVGLDLEEVYTDKIESPAYEIRGEKPEIAELFDALESKKLLEKIEASNLPDEEKEFLRYAAFRHVVFDYSKIAEYYAHSDATTQLLMEESALVIIDINKAIERGFVVLSDEIEQQYLKDQEYEEA